jgi:hypothetical protein
VIKYGCGRFVCGKRGKSPEGEVRDKFFLKYRELNIRNYKFIKNA